jgi:hypothetical protein
MNMKRGAIAIAIAAALGTSGSAYAAAITSITIGDVGSTTGSGPGGGGGATYSSTLDGRVGGFRFAAINPNNYLGVTGFTGDTGNDMDWSGAAQPNYNLGANPSAFTTGFIFAGSAFEPDLTAGGALGDITGGVMTVSNLSFGGFYQGALFQFNMTPDAAPVVNWVVAAGGGDYKVSFQWTHYITPTDDPSYTYAGLTASWILEGTAHTGGGTAPVPIPAAAWLLGSGLVGLTAIGRRRKRSAA